jgi:hypothetical protein
LTRTPGTIVTLHRGSHEPLAKIGVAISIIWLIGLSIFLLVYSTLKILVDVLFAANLNSLTLWSVMLGPIVLLWSIGIIAAEAMRWMRERQATAEEDEEGGFEDQASHSDLDEGKGQDL